MREIKRQLRERRKKIKIFKKNKIKRSQQETTRIFAIKPSGDLAVNRAKHG